MVGVIRSSINAAACRASRSPTSIRSTASTALPATQ
jgi:hypothetical protein